MAATEHALKIAKVAAQAAFDKKGDAESLPTLSGLIKISAETAHVLLIRYLVAMV